ncbi:dihydroflavonol-4-reductase [Pedobacter sp. UYP30]|uniref:NAD-dependent epimerase/dehydratase family protein n=1 Tax=Pedobacter sp. UYP30 TaxID=1756400 RepID=UPI0033974389
MILVTGGTGFLGSELIKQLTDANQPVRAIKRATSTIPKILLNQPLIEWQNADINEPATLADVFQNITKVYHCAAFVSLSGSDKKKLYHVNIDGTSNVINLCQEYKCRLLHVSSVAALGDAREDAEINEDDYWEYNASAQPYGLSKYEGEMEVWRGIAEGLNAVIVNPSVIIGESVGFEGSGAIFKMIKDGFKFYTDGATGLVDVKDVAKAMILLMESQFSGERFIISSENYTYKDLFGAIADGFGLSRPKIEAKSWMLGIAWRALKVGALLTGKTPAITKDTAKSSITNSYYCNEKISNAINIKFKPVLASIKDITNYLS